MMKQVLANFNVLTAQIAAFEALTTPLIQASRAEVGNVSYDLYQNVQVPENFEMVELWDDQAALEDHNQAPHFQQFMTQVTDLLADTPQIQVFDR